ncbi:uncharacterized protein TRIVIDRAFT_228135 [Trichoderma virens Gv29-8]|uniref:Clr5 domain-containing protein n=1 Tax=Hypocrea virens (strain Gv29-8 / FGSC 10586) TaxID=413071 RepID=G9NBK6_HYPVG|nr:uncharacterized protein TRIVIDRAFT_228135 [Trichoderma virens Gv29-8]EHK16211.1 hypothetical protein TRIVIDRAFT_228135 [Trichoderma virens Gv29-8]UKZ56013.1 hypothetical protein TrVGV298_009837 [Trichoderma virens]
MANLQEAGCGKSPISNHESTLQKLDLRNLKLAQVLAVLNQDGVFIETVSVDANDSDRLDFLKFKNKSSLAELIHILESEGLIKCQDSGTDQKILLHDTWRLTLQRKLYNEKELFQPIFNAAVSLIRRKFPRQSPVQFPQNDIWGVCKKYSPHIISLMEVHAASLVPPEPSIDYALLLSDASNYFYERNFFADALRTADASVEACKHIDDCEAARADIHTIAAAVRDTSGISERSKTLHHYIMAIALRQECLNKSKLEDVTHDDLWNYANAWGNMTPILLDYGCYEDVIVYAEFAMTIKRKLFSHERESTIACYEQYRNKHIALAALGRFEDAQRWRPDPENCIDDPRYTVIMIRYYFFHANIAIICGKLDAAYESLQKTLEMRTKFFGPTGRSTLDTYYLLAMLEIRRGNNDAAEAHLRKALESPNDWTDEACARARYKLPQLLLSKDDGEAQHLLKEASERLATYWEKYARYWPRELDLPDEDEMYDHIVPAEAGRLSMTKLLPLNTLTRGLNDICRQLASRLKSDDAALATKELAQLLKTQSSMFHLVP